MELLQVDGVEDGANLMSKCVGQETLENDMKNCGMTTLGGRRADALKLEVNAAGISKQALLVVLTLASICKGSLPTGMAVSCLTGASGHTTEDGAAGPGDERDYYVVAICLMLTVEVLVGCCCS